MNHEQYVIPLVVLERGLNCACIYNGLWHRGIIKSVKPDLQVTVSIYIKLIEIVKLYVIIVDNNLL